MKSNDKDSKFEKAVVRETLDVMNRMTYAWIKGGWHMSRHERTRLKKLHCH